MMQRGIIDLSKTSLSASGWPPELVKAHLGFSDEMISHLSKVKQTLVKWHFPFIRTLHFEVYLYSSQKASCDLTSIIPHEIINNRRNLFASRLLCYWVTDIDTFMLFV